MSKYLRCAKVPFAPDYYVNRDGQIFSTKKGVFLRNRDNGNGYKTVSLFTPSSNKYETYYVHRVVLSSLLRMPKKGDEVNHKNGDKSDNRLCNLEWCNKSENMIHAFKQLNIHNGENHYKTKITNKQHKEIFMKFLNGVSKASLAKEYGYASTHSITRILKGDRWKHVEK